MVLATTTVLLVCCPATAAAAPVLVEAGTLTTSGAASVVLTLPSATTSGDFLVAALEDRNGNCATDNFTGPSGWSKAASTCKGAVGPLQVWYDPSATGGISSFTFNTGSTGASMEGQVSEWSGISSTNTLDQTGASNVTSGSTTLTVSTSGNISVGSELAVSAFETNAGLTSFASGAGWALLGHDPSNGFDSDYRVGPPSGSVLSESATSNPGTKYGGVIASFLPACVGGSLTFETAPTVTFPGVTMNGYNASSTTTITFTLSDESGTGNGWDLNATSTPLTGGTHTLPTTATRFTGASYSAAAGNCVLPSNSITYPVTLPAGSGPPTAVDLFDAATHTGEGPANVTLSAAVAVPANAFATAGGLAYTSTWTFTLSSGP